MNLGSDRADSQEDASNILIANKQWRVIPIKTTYLGSNWPIRVCPESTTKMLIIKVTVTLLESCERPFSKQPTHDALTNF